MPTKPPFHRAPGLGGLSDTKRVHDHRRRDDPDRKFVQSRKWREVIRPAQLELEPLCRFCRAMGYVKAAEQVDHIVRRAIAGCKLTRQTSSRCAPITTRRSRYGNGEAMAYRCR